MAIKIVEEQNFFIAVGVLGGVCLVLFCAVIGLIIWVSKIQKKINKITPLANFKIKRPQIRSNEDDYQPYSPPSIPRNDYDNAGYRPSVPAFQKPQGGGGVNPINPISQRTQPQSMDNRNFSFGAGPSNPQNRVLPNENSRFANDRFY